MKFNRCNSQCFIRRRGRKGFVLNFHSMQSSFSVKITKEQMRLAPFHLTLADGRKFTQLKTIKNAKALLQNVA